MVRSEKAIFQVAFFGFKNCPPEASPQLALSCMPGFLKYFAPCIACLQMILITSCSVSDGEETLFTKMSDEETGLDFINENHETEKTNILSYEYYYNGGGVALGDIN